MERNQFTFYVSFFKTIRRIRSKTARADAYDAICNYALNGVMPDLEKMSGAAAMAFEAAQPSLRAGRRKAENGSLSGVVRQTASKTEANDEQTESKIKGKDKDKVEDKIKNKNKCSLYPPRSGGARERAKPAVTSGPAGTAPLGEIEREALAAMLKGKGGEENA